MQIHVTLAKKFYASLPTPFARRFDMVTFKTKQSRNVLILDLDAI